MTVFLALGETAPSEDFGTAKLQFIPYQENTRKVAEYYQAADVYVHAAKVDTFPNTVLEALACGTPVVATAVGGIPEQINGYRLPEERGVAAELNIFGANEATGILTPPGDAGAMSRAISRLLTDVNLRWRLGGQRGERRRGPLRPPAPGPGLSRLVGGNSGESASNTDTQPVQAILGQGARRREGVRSWRGIVWPPKPKTRRPNRTAASQQESNLESHSG